MSKEITDKIDSGDLSMKPGWVRLSLHPTMTDNELLFIIDAIRQVVQNSDEWGKDYGYNNLTNEFNHIQFPEFNNINYSGWFKL